MHFTLKENQMTYEHLRDFVKCYNPENRHKREETERFKRFTYEDITNRDKTSLDIFWLKDESLGDMENLPEPDVLANDIIENLEAGLESFKEVQGKLYKN
jgi:type I restriction enzyme M protein